MWALYGGSKSLPCYFEDNNQVAVVGKALNTIHFNIYYVDGTTSLGNDATRELGLGWYIYDYSPIVDNKDFIYNAVDTTAANKNFPGGFVELQTKSVDNVYTDTPVNVWTNTTRTLSSFGTLVADITTSVWGAGTRSLTTFGTLVADITTSVWGAGTRSLTTFGTLVADITTSVWGATTRTLTSFGTLVANVWDYLTTSITVADSIGKLVKDNLDTTVSSRSSQTSLTTHDTSLTAHRNAMEGGASGGFIVTIQYYETATTTPIVQATSVVRNSDSSAILTRLTTDTNGQVIFNLGAGTYKIYSYKLGQYSFTLPETLVVSLDMSVTYYGSPFVIPTPSIPGVCRVYCWQYKPDGTPLEQVLVSAQLQQGPYFTDNVSILVTQASVYTDSNGYWHLDLTQSALLVGDGGKKYLVECGEASYSKEILVPSAATVNLKDL